MAEIPNAIENETFDEFENKKEVLVICQKLTIGVRNFKEK